MRADRQLRGAGCRWGMMASLFALSVAISAPARAVSIAADGDGAVAPATITLTASSTLTEAIVDYRWIGLDSAPRCRGASCMLELSIASCVRVELRATTELGETATATRSVCAGDGAGMPPSADIAFISGDAGASMQVAPSWYGGSDAVVVSRLWIDAEEKDFVRTDVSWDDGGCHAVDVFVGDAKGRAGIAHRDFCASADAPVLWLGAMGGAVSKMSTRVFCGEADHPLALTLTKLEGEAPLDACGEQLMIDPEPAHHVLRAKDSRGVVSTASLISVLAPSRGAPVLVFASLEGLRIGKDARSFSAGMKFSTTLQIFGGEPPFTVTGALRSDLPLSTAQAADPRMPVLSLDRLPAGGTYTLTATVTDGRGLVAHASHALKIESPQNSDPSASKGAAACTAIGGPERARHAPFANASWLAILALALLAASRRRRR